MLPKKYAKMGFKKGWKAYKSQGTKKIKKVSYMAKKRTYKRKSSGMNSTFKDILYSGVYATIGEPILDTLASKVGLSTSDELIKGAIGLGMVSFGKGAIRNIGKTALDISTYKLSKQYLPNLLSSVGLTTNSTQKTTTSSTGATF